MKVGVSSYSFARYMNSGNMDIFGVVEAAAALGFEGIEFSGLKMPEGESDPVVLAGRVRRACETAGLAVLNYPVGADFLDPASGGGWQDEVERLKGELHVAAALGSPCMRHDASRGAGRKVEDEAAFREALPVLSDGCRAVAEYAAGLGIRTMVENHGFFVQDSARCAALFEAVGHDNFGLLVDIGNFLCADEEPLDAVTRLAPMASHVHAKDFHRQAAFRDPGKGWFKTRGGNWLRGSIIGHGDVDVTACLRSLSQAGYDGFVSIEFEGLEDNREALEMGLENLRRYIVAAEGE